ncbi:hypothetical protein LNKW23_30990 [Paralimibaculum aggregatum]|uniref:YjiS-like domain-containing protein n=2 Tax=Paralimibaculum aggregatum TaxID=3036245 RepID=A0ABQ6LNN0_9RHOB|nr:hypothetical protein LNKW23_30990 [Limibaculum sp. NKW23]
MSVIATLIDTATPRASFHFPVARWIAVARERRALAAKTDRELADMGISPEAARREAARPFWDTARR